MRILLVNPSPQNEIWRDKKLNVIAKVPGGCVVDNYLDTRKTFAVRYDEYIEINPVTEIEELRHKVYKYELALARLLVTPDLIVQAAVKNELDNVNITEGE